jgi:2-dehydro-3-deoxyphosphooctonate aldolase (KDO 8-P synthase)
MDKTVSLGRVQFNNSRPFVLIAGPCVIESESLVMKEARALKAAAKKLNVPFIFKSSYDKANRSSLSGFRGPGLKNGLKILARVRKEVGVPVLTDVHSVAELAQVAAVVDVLQIPAFLCRQTDLLLAAGRTGKPVNIKKGQFMAPWDMTYAVKKVESTGNKKILLTERGATFGYNNLVVDMRSLLIMKKLGYPVVYDVTHSVQLPGGQGGSSGGQREFAWPLARAAAALGVAGLFMEVHPNPDRALSDGPNSVFLKDLPKNLLTLKRIDALSK